MEIFTTKKLGGVLTFPLRDPRWVVKILIAVGLMLAAMIIPLVPTVFYYGYIHRIMDRIINGDGAFHLPEWNDWGDLAGKGIRLMGIALIYNIPVFLLTFAVIIGSMAPIIGFNAFIMGGGDPSEAWWMLLIGSFMSLATIPMMLVTVPLTLCMMVGMGRAVETGRFGGGFDFPTIWSVLKRSFGWYLLLVIVLNAFIYVSNMVLQLLIFTVVLCCLFPFAMMAVSVYTGMVGMAMNASLYRQSRSVAGAQSVQVVVE